MVAALVSDDPDAGEEAALEEPVKGPCNVRERFGEKGEIGNGEGEEERDNGEVGK